MDLPRALMPWAPYLDIFPRELATALGPLVQRLDLAIGPLRAHSRAGQGEPDGFHGIARRGSYERLLISEWLLAEEFPAEFERRAIMGEHGFLELARRQPVEARTSVALFDAGPNQLGAPRIAQLASLIVLARRADAAGVEFRWAILQQSKGAFHTAVTVNTITQLLRSRDCREATDADAANWRDLGDSQVGADDIWLIGGRRLGKLPAAKGASCLHITDPLLPEAGDLTLEVVNAGRIGPTITLPLPEDRICARLIRDPFVIRRVAPPRALRRFAPTSNLIFAVGGTKLLARAGQDHLVVYPVPNSPNAGAGKPKFYHTASPAPILAAGRVGKGLALVTMERQSQIHIEFIGSKSGKDRDIEFLLPPGLTVNPPKADDSLAPCFRLQDADGRVQWLVLVSGRLLCASRAMPRQSEPYMTGVVTGNVELEQVLAASMTDAGCTFVGKGKADAMQAVLMSVMHNGTNKIHRMFNQVLQAHFGYCGPRRDPTDGVAALELVAGEWTIVLPHGDLLLVQPLPDDTVVGLVALSGKGIPSLRDNGLETGLILLRPERRRITVIGRNWTRSVPPASSPIKHFAANPYGPEIAYLTEQGELVIYSLAQEAVLYRLLTGAEP